MTPVKRNWRVKCRQCWAEFTPRRGHNKVTFCYDCLPDGVKTRRWYDTIRIYEVDRNMWEAMYFEQDGTCPICLEREATDVDHCHATGKVRGLLCTRCNSVLGDMEKPGRLDRALEYLGDSR